MSRKRGRTMIAAAQREIRLGRRAASSLVPGPSQSLRPGVLSRREHRGAISARSLIAPFKLAQALTERSERSVVPSLKHRELASVLSPQIIA